MNKNIYDVIIIGGGVSGVFTGFSLIMKNPSLKILIIEKGLELSKRICPIENKKTIKCINCKPCNKLFGFGGLGRSEGKFNFTTDFGGDLQDKIGYNKTHEYFNKVEAILKNFGGSEALEYSTFNENFNKKCESSNIKSLFSQVLHLGLDTSINIWENIFEFLKNKIYFSFNSEVLGISKIKNQNTEDNVFEVISSKEVFYANKVIVATNETSNLLDSFKLSSSKIRVDLGLRLETHIDYFKDILNLVPEFKMKYKDAYTYCMNPHGYIIKKHQFGYSFADGQNYREKGMKSDNLNFTIFIPQYFESEDLAHDFINKTMAKINKSNQELLLQRLDDFYKNLPSTMDKIKTNNIKPTNLEVNLDDINEIFNKEFIDSTKGLLKSLEKLTDKSLEKDSLLYGADIKTYSPVIKTNNKFETSVSGLYIIGDASGITWSLSQAAASGLYLGENIS